MDQCSKTGSITFGAVLTILEIFCHNFFAFFSTFFLQIFSHCQNLIHQISRRSKSGTHQEIRLCKNIVCSLARTIQEMSTNFKKFQSSYLQREYCFFFVFFFRLFTALPPKIVFLPLRCLLFFHLYIATHAMCCSSVLKKELLIIVAKKGHKLHVSSQTHSNLDSVTPISEI